MTKMNYYIIGLFFVLLRHERQVAIDVVTNTVTNAGLVTSSSIFIIIVIVPTKKNHLCPPTS